MNKPITSLNEFSKIHSYYEKQINDALKDNDSFKYEINIALMIKLEQEHQVLTQLYNNQTQNMRTAQ